MQRRKSYIAPEESHIVDLSIYFIFLAAVILKAYYARSLYLYHVIDGMKSLYFKNEIYTTDNLTKSIHEIVITKDFWDYVENVLLPKTYETDSQLHDYMETKDSKEEEEEKKKVVRVLDENILLGPPRLRQLRIRSDACDVHPSFIDHYAHCYAAYDTNFEETNGTHFGKEYKTRNELKATLIHGAIQTYYGGGFIIPLEYNYTESKSIIAHLSDNLWVDRATRLVVYEFNLFNENEKILISIKMIAEFPATGGTQLTYDVRAIHMHLTFRSPSKFWVWLASSFVLILHFYYTYHSINSMIYKSWTEVFSDFWTWIENTHNVLLWFVVFYEFWHIWYSKRLYEQYKQGGQEFLSLDHLNYWFDWYLAIFAVCTFFVGVKSLHFLALTNTAMSDFTTTLKRCWKDLLGFSVLFMVIFLSYCLLGLLFFGSKSLDFKDFNHTFFSMMKMTIGGYNPDVLQDEFLFLSMIFYVTCLIIVYCVLLNTALAIVSYTFMKVFLDRQSGRLRSEIPLWVSIKALVRKLCFCCFKDGKLRRTTRFRPNDSAALLSESEMLSSYFEPEKAESVEDKKLKLHKDELDRLREQSIAINRSIALLNETVDQVLKNVETQQKKPR